MFAEIADVTFERKMNSIFGSINSSSTQLARPLNNKGIGIIVNENYFATRKVMCRGPRVFHVIVITNLRREKKFVSQHV